MAMSGQTSLLHGLGDVAMWLGMISASVAVASAVATAITVGVTARRELIRAPTHQSPGLINVAWHLTGLVLRGSFGEAANRSDESMTKS
jgi:hypothetical protein